MVLTVRAFKSVYQPSPAVFIERALHTELKLHRHGRPPRQLSLLPGGAPLCSCTVCTRSRPREHLCPQTPIGPSLSLPPVRLATTPPPPGDRLHPHGARRPTHSSSNAHAEHRELACPQDSAWPCTHWVKGCGLNFLQAAVPERTPRSAAGERLCPRVVTSDLHQQTSQCFQPDGCKWKSHFSLHFFNYN